LCCSILISEDGPDEHAEETHMLSIRRTLIGMHFFKEEIYSAGQMVIAIPFV
jgi:hypothetical protein